ncbi:MAG: hypothetical protein M9942_02495 [Microthrixaceae bacterium]|nr:hypothetical protein [Microthrixaceae bacterium]
MIPRRCRRSTYSERGSGLIPTLIGLGVTIGMLGLAVNVSLGLWSRTRTESIAYETVRRVATAPPESDGPTRRIQALERACDELGERCGEVELRFVHDDSGPDMVALRVRSPGVGLLPRFIAGGGPVVAGLDRTIRMHREGA